MSKGLTLPVGLFAPLALLLLSDYLEVNFGMVVVGRAGAGVGAAAAVVLGPLAIFRATLGAWGKTSIRAWLASAVALLASCSWLFVVLLVVVNFHLAIGGAL